VGTHLAYQHSRMPQKLQETKHRWRPLIRSDTWRNAWCLQRIRSSANVENDRRVVLLKCLRMKFRCNTSDAACRMPSRMTGSRLGDQNLGPRIETLPARHSTMLLRYPYAMLLRAIARLAVPDSGRGTSTSLLYYHVCRHSISAGCTATSYRSLTSSASTATATVSKAALKLNFSPGSVTIGWIGTGVMGSSMCAHLINKGRLRTVRSTVISQQCQADSISST